MQNLTLFKQLNSNNHHRSVMIIRGDWQFCIAQLSELIDINADSWYLGDNEHPFDAKTIAAKQAKHYLGSQCQQLIIDTHNGLDLNAFGALTGCLVAGGNCFILTPSAQHWPNQHDKQNDRFNAIETPNITMLSANHLTTHLNNVIEQSIDIAVISNITQHIPSIKPQLPSKFIHPIYYSEAQQIAVEKIIKVATGHRNRPLVLTADRGRGKSSALGLGASELIKAGKTNIIISAPQRSSVTPVFERLSEQLENSQQSNKTDPQHLTFVAIDTLIAEKPDASLVLIDEAAAIAAPLLTQLISHYSRIVLTSTITGYEGTGRSFEIRFKHKLAELKPQWQQFHLTTPIRFANNDPLEKLTNRTLMLDAQAANIDEYFRLTSAQYQHQDRAQLVANSQLLAQIVGLLSLAHYKTSPNDIRHLLNGNNIDIHTLCLQKNGQQHIIAVAMVAKEGGFAATTTAQIAQGQKRPKGHLLPLTLSAHSGLIDAPNFTFARIVRIAAHPALQQQGLGSQLLKRLEQHYQQQTFDFIGSSFGANQPLLSFWLKQRFAVLRIGLTIEASSNEYAAVVLKSLNDNKNKKKDKDKQAFIENAITRFEQQFFMQIKEDNQQVCPFVVMMLLNTNKSSKPLSQQQNQDMHYYLNFHREYEFCSHTLQAWLIYQLNQHLSLFLNLPSSQASLLIDKLIKQQSWSTIVKTYKFDGKKNATTAFKQLIKHLETSLHNHKPDIYLTSGQKI